MAESFAQTRRPRLRTLAGGGHLKMATQHTVGALDLAAGRARPARSGMVTVLRDYWALTKPEVNFLILVTTFAGFYLASGPGGLRILPVVHVLLGTLLVASGTGTLNQYI